jgi:hypothetical protein
MARTIAMLAALCFAKWDRYFNFSGQHGFEKPSTRSRRSAGTTAPIRRKSATKLRQVCLTLSRADELLTPHPEHQHPERRAETITRRVFGALSLIKKIPTQEKPVPPYYAFTYGDDVLSMTAVETFAEAVAIKNALQPISTRTVARK